MNILVIGNGFDLAHGLKTSYRDFIEEIIKIENSNESIYYKEFQELISENVWVNYFVNEYMKKDINCRWVDFEEEISNVIQMIDYFKNGDGKLAEHRQFNFDEEIWYDKINIFKKKATIAYDDDLIKMIENDLSKLIRALEIYLSLFVEDTAIKEEMNISNIDKVITFNYTNTYQRIYDKDNKTEYDYIHGKVNIENTIRDTNMVLGIDEYLEGERKDKELEFIFFKKYFQRIYKKTGCKYKKWVEEIKEYSSYMNYVYIFGHSLAKSDKDILRDLILLENTKVIIFYHNKDAYRSQITNLVEIITQDKLIEMVYGNDPKIKFISTENQSEFTLIGNMDNQFEVEVGVYY